MACEIYQIAQQTHTQMMGYVIKTSDGKLVVVDGGTKGEAEYLWYLLRRFGGEKPHVDAWFLTHPHSDHVFAFYGLLREHGDEFTVGALYAHFPVRRVLEIGEPGALFVWDEYYALRPLFAAYEHVIEENDVITVGDSVWRVLYVSDPEITKNASNNSSCVLRMECEGVSVLFLSDLGKEAGDKMMAGHQDELKSDIVQMAHHGQSAVKMDVYHAVQPKMCLWCAPKWLWDNNQGCRGYDSGVWDILRVREEMDKLRVRHHVVAKDGTMKITLENGQFSVSCFDPHAAQ